ncbi:hypothetical protein TKK_0016063 [Trichogramma kaykai]|uniref:PiggyBac transposable element-derived protein domain-containing protein n=1 Tax=Trichogramma kaykai TaxID=54128 RepID=A0ABD2WA24_9HYME
MSNKKTPNKKRGRVNIEDEEIVSELEESCESDCGSEDFNNLKNSDWFDHTSDLIPTTSYDKVRQQYTYDQKKLASDHEYEWIDGEKSFPNVVKNEFLLSEATKKKIRSASFTEVFEYFFSTEMKNYLIESTKENDYKLSLQNLNVFIGIIVISIFNVRKDQCEYWSTDPLLTCTPVVEAMSRREFKLIKSRMKLSKKSDVSDTDKA